MALNPNIPYILWVLPWFNLFWPRFNVKLGQNHAKTHLNVGNMFYILYYQMFGSKKTDRIRYYRMFGIKELLGFFTTECSIRKNGLVILSPLHF